MAKICEKCGRKVGIFDVLYKNKYCEKCYKEVKIEEERRKKEEEIEEAEEKINSAKYYFLYTNYYYTILDKINSIPFHYDDIFNYDIKNKFDIIKRLLNRIILELPKDFNLRDLKKITTYRKSSKIMHSALWNCVKRPLDYQKYCDILVYDEQHYSRKPNNNILDDEEINSYKLFLGTSADMETFFNAVVNACIEKITILQEYIDDIIGKASKPKYDYRGLMTLKKERELEQTFEIIWIYYYYAIEILYYIFFNKMVENIINKSELYEIYNKLKLEVHNENYIIDKLFSIYNSLYKDEFEVILEDELQFSLLIESIKFREKVAIKSDYVDINTSILNIDINKYVNNSNDNDIIYSIHNELFDRIASYEKYLSIDDILDIFFYSKKNLDIFREIKKQQAFNEKERILNENFEKEEKVINKFLDYSKISNGYEFEEYVANLYSLLGYEIENITSKSGDQGADVLLEKNGIKYAVQVKFYSNTVGNKAVQEIVAAKSFYKTDKAVVVTNNYFTKSAIELAKASDVILIDKVRLDKMIDECKKNQM